MPRITEQRREQRRRQILTTAWTCFSRNGFHATSMDDVIAACGMSASGVYRYFRSKDELIDAAGQEAMGMFRRLFDRLLAMDPAPGPAATISALMEPMDTDGDYDLSRVAIQAWSEALRQPQLRDGTREFYREMRTHLTDLAYRWRSAGHLAPQASPEAVGLLLATLMPGMLVARHLVDGITAEEVLAGIRGLAGAREQVGTHEPVRGR